VSRLVLFDSVSQSFSSISIRPEAVTAITENVNDRSGPTCTIYSVNHKFDVMGSRQEVEDKLFWDKEGD
jgi:hypothetical protein